MKSISTSTNFVENFPQTTFKNFSALNEIKTENEKP